MWYCILKIQRCYNFQPAISNIPSWRTAPLWSALRNAASQTPSRTWSRPAHTCRDWGALWRGLHHLHSCLPQNQEWIRPAWGVQHTQRLVKVLSQKMEQIENIDTFCLSYREVDAVGSRGLIRIFLCVLYLCWWICWPLVRAGRLPQDAKFSLRDLVTL